MEIVKTGKISITKPLRSFANDGAHWHVTIDVRGGYVIKKERYDGDPVGPAYSMIVSSKDETTFVCLKKDTTSGSAPFTYLIDKIVSVDGDTVTEGVSDEYTGIRLFFQYRMDDGMIGVTRHGDNICLVGEDLSVTEIRTDRRIYDIHTVKEVRGNNRFCSPMPKKWMYTAYIDSGVEAGVVDFGNNRSNFLMLGKGGECLTPEVPDYFIRTARTVKMRDLDGGCFVQLTLETGSYMLYNMDMEACYPGPLNRVMFSFDESHALIEPDGGGGGGDDAPGVRYGAFRAVWDTRGVLRKEDDELYSIENFSDMTIGALRKSGEFHKTLLDRKNFRDITGDADLEDFLEYYGILNDDDGTLATMLGVTIKIRNSGILYYNRRTGTMACEGGNPWISGPDKDGVCVVKDGHGVIKDIETDETWG